MNYRDMFIECAFLYIIISGRMRATPSDLMCIACSHLHMNTRIVAHREGLLSALDIVPAAHCAFGRVHREAVAVSADRLVGRKVGEVVVADVPRLVVIGCPELESAPFSGAIGPQEDHMV